jgi:hypothetical protein
MPRNRSSKSTTNTNEREGVSKMAGLTADQIQTLLGKTRTKGVYVQYLNQFIASGEAGVNVNEQWVDLRDKKATTLKQGFENAKDNKEAADGAENVKVISNEDLVYLINLSAAGIEVPPVAEPALA